MAIVLALITLNWVFVVRVLPSFERYKPVPRLSAAIRQRFHDGDKVVHYNVALPSMVFYLRRHIDVLFDRELFLKTLRGGGTVYAVLSATDYAALGPRIGGADLRARTSIDSEREAEGRARKGAVAGGAPDHESVSVTRFYTVLRGSAEFYRVHKVLQSSEVRGSLGSLTNLVEPA